MACNYNNENQSGLILSLKQSQLKQQILIDLTVQGAKFKNILCFP